VFALRIALLISSVNSHQMATETGVIVGPVIQTQQPGVEFMSNGPDAIPVTPNDIGLNVTFSHRQPAGPASNDFADRPGNSSAPTEIHDSANAFSPPCPPPPTPNIAFQGTAQTGWIPPDPNLAVGPGHIVEVVNTHMRVTTKAGVQTMSTLLTLAEFWSGLGVVGLTTDPRIIYDQYSGRFVLAMLEVGVNFVPSYVLLAVSQTTDPNGIWFKYRHDSTTVIDGNAYWTDYTGVAVDAQAIYFTANLFTGTAPFGGVKYRIFNKFPLLTGAPAVYQDLVDISGASESQLARPAHAFGMSQAAYFLGAQANGVVRLTAITHPLTNPVLSTFDLAVPSYQFPLIAAPNLGGLGLDPMDGRILNAFWRNGRLVAAHGILSGNRVITRWYDIATHNWPMSGSPTLNQSGDIDPSAGVFTFMPAISVNRCGQIAMIVARSATTERLSLAVTGRNFLDPPGTMQPLTTLITSSVGYSPTNTRFGDYFGAAIDPTDDQTFWFCGEYATGINTWSTWISSYTFAGCCLSPTINPTSDAAAICGTPFTSSMPTVTGEVPITWSLLDAPAGAAINSATGVVTWSSPVASPQPYTLTVQAINACGSDLLTWQLIVKPGDFDGDGLVSIADMPGFLGALTLFSTNQPCAGDVDLDGLVNGRDIAQFVGAVEP